MSALLLLLAMASTEGSDCSSWSVGGVRLGMPAADLGLKAEPSGRVHSVQIPSRRLPREISSLEVCIDETDRVIWVYAVVRPTANFVETYTSRYKPLLDWGGCWDGFYPGSDGLYGTCWTVLWSECDSSIVLEDGDDPDGPVATVLLRRGAPKVAKTPLPEGGWSLKLVEPEDLDAWRGVDCIDPRDRQRRRDELRETLLRASMRDTFAVWNACGELVREGDETHVRALIRALGLSASQDPEKGDAPILCSLALSEITKQDFGESYESWARWWNEAHPDAPLPVQPNSALQPPRAPGSE